jgi:hypothetical protein
LELNYSTYFQGHNFTIKTLHPKKKEWFDINQ